MISDKKKLRKIYSVLQLEGIVHYTGKSCQDHDIYANYIVSKISKNREKKLVPFLPFLQSESSEEGDASLS